MGLLHESLHLTKCVRQLRAGLHQIEKVFNLTIEIEGYTKADIPDLALDGVTFSYDGKLLTEITLGGTINQSLRYNYNNDFNLTEFTYSGGTASYLYDMDHLLIGSSGYTISRNLKNGLPESVSGKGLNISRSFNGHRELDEQSVTISSQPAMQWSLSRDNAGRIISKIETIGGDTQTIEYGYDSMGRLLTVMRDATLVEEYTYDLSGTRITEANTLRRIANRSFSYSDEDHLLTAGESIYSYDLDGFLATKTEAGQVTTYNYSTRGELLEVGLPDGRTISYEHDPLGRRIAKRMNGVIIEKYLWGGLTKLLAIYDGSDNLVQRFEYADDRMPVAMTMGGRTYFLVYDQVGSLRLVTDGSGNMVKRIDYDTFGNIIDDTNRSLTLPLGFAGGLHDRDTGLVRFGYRDYDPDTGRWTAKDPIRFSGGDTDLYGYVQNNPVNVIDTDGRVGFLVKFIYGRIANAVINAIDDNSAGESEREWRQWVDQNKQDYEDYLDQKQWEYLNSPEVEKLMKEIEERIRLEDERKMNPPC